MLCSVYRFRTHRKPVKSNFCIRVIKIRIFFSLFFRLALGNRLRYLPQRNFNFCISRTDDINVRNIRLYIYRNNIAVLNIIFRQIPQNHAVSHNFCTGNKPQADCRNKKKENRFTHTRHNIKKKLLLLSKGKNQGATVSCNRLSAPTAA